MNTHVSLLRTVPLSVVILLATAFTSSAQIIQKQSPETASKPLATRPAAQRGNALQQADRAWNEKSYRRALELYRLAIKQGAVRDRDEADFRIAVALGKTQQWDAAITAGQNLLNRTPRQARTLYWMGRLYADRELPHEAYYVNKRYYRGRNYPKVKSAEKPVMVYLWDKDMQRSFDYLERAKIAAQQARGRRSTPGILPAAEEIDLNFDLAATVARLEIGKLVEALEGRVKPKPSLDENIALNQPYNRKWHMAKKVLYLHNETPRLDKSSNKHDTVLALFAKGLFVQTYRAQMEGWAQRYNQKDKKTYYRHYPFDTLDPRTYWREIVARFPRDSVAPQAQLRIAHSVASGGLRQRPDLVKALAEYRVVMQKFPTSRWAKDAAASIQQITRHQLEFTTLGAQPPGQNAKLSLMTRNLKAVSFTAYRAHLENTLLQPRKLNNSQVHFPQFSPNFGSVANVRKYLGKPVTAWSTPTGDKGNYFGVRKNVNIPLKNTGAYVVVAQAPGIRFAQLLLISDLAILKKSDRDQTLVYVADARTGRPVAGANVVVKEVYNDSNGNNKTSVSRGRSDANGLFSKKSVQGEGVDTNVAEVLAWSGNRYAMTGSEAYYYWDNPEEEAGALKVYTYTDRPVYRPEQKVYFRQILTRRIAGGEQQPAKGVRVMVNIRNPKNETILSKTFTSSEFGTVNGELTLPAEAPLGEYYIESHKMIENGMEGLQGDAHFRVEEYKRPEFLVKVDAQKEPVRPGETVAARIGVQYYFGGAVPNAKVKYTIRRSYWWPSYQFPRPYQWLYAHWNIGDYSTGRRNIGGEGSGAIIKEGTATTDAQGNAEVTFKTDDANSGIVTTRGEEYAQPLYTVEAEVVDASRRTIEAQGQVKAARQQYFAFLDTKQGYYLTGDRVPIELVTQDANGRPFGARGKMVVYKVLPDDKMGKPVEEKVYEEAIDTSEQNPAFWNWTAKGAGTFRVAYETTDAWGQKVRASVSFWVHGPEMSSTKFKLRGVTIQLNNRHYEEGDTLKALLVADKPDTTVLLTQEAGNQILSREVVHIEGKSREIEIPITRRHVPNFAVAVALVKDYQIYRADAEVFVPPAKQLINVEVEPDKDEYKPGETGMLRIKATDWQGKPARAEVSVALTDASLFYIQQSYTPDIRTFYYGERRDISVNLDSHRSGRPEGRNEDDRKYTEYEQHELSLPDNLGQLNLPPGGLNYYPFYGGPYEYGGNGYAGDDVSYSDQTEASVTAAMPPPGVMPGGGGAEYEMRRVRRADRLMAPASKSTFNAASNAMTDDDDASTLANAEVRSNFAETAFWSPAVVTENGAANVKVTFPDSLTQWHAEARGLTQSTQVGSGENDVTTKKNLMVRLQAPRFFVERDQVVVSAIVNNYLKTDKQVKVALQIGDNLKFSPGRAGTALVSDVAAPNGTVEVKAGEESRLNWIVDVAKDGPTNIKVIAQTDEESDAMQMKFPVLVHGVSRFDGATGVLRSGENRETFTINLPAERRRGASSLNVQLNPSLAATMLDALPYLADYPYGCVEQTMSRFMPSAVVAKTLTDSGIDLKTLRQRAKAYAAEAKAKPVAERISNSGYTYPTGMPNSRDLQEMSSRFWYTDRASNPIFDEAQLNKMVQSGLDRLYQMQRSDGGWGWWRDSPQSDEYMSAYVMQGLAMARVPVKGDVVIRGFTYLRRQMKDEDSLQLLTWIGYPLSLRGTMEADIKQIVTGRLFTQRARLTPYSKALLALTLANIGEKAKATTLIRNLEDSALIDEANGTATWKMGNDWWRWWNNDVETNAWVLRALLKIEPKNRLTPMAMKWLTVQARGNHWRSTKETALAVLALADYVRVNKELDVDYTLKVRLGNKIERTYRVTAENALYFDNRFIVGDFLLQDGANQLTIEKNGRGNLYWNAALEYFSLEEPIKASGNEIAVKRRYFKLTRNANKTGQEYSRSEIKDDAELKSGDLVEVELTVDSNNDYEYLVFEDMKAAGMEPVELRSGAAWGDGLCSNVELRDEKVALFVDRLPQGTRVLRYRMRAEIPGRFHALPTNGYAMYAPEVRAISDEWRMGTRD